MSSKLSKLADIVRIAARSYDAGKRDTAIKLVGIVASKLEASERQNFLNMVNNDIQGSGIRIYLQSIVIGHRGDSTNPK